MERVATSMHWSKIPFHFSNRSIIINSHKRPLRFISKLSPLVKLCTHIYAHVYLRVAVTHASKEKKKKEKKKGNKEKNTSYHTVKGLQSQRNRFETQVPIVSNPRSRNSTIPAITKRFTIRWHSATIVPFLNFHPLVCTSSISNRDSSKNTYSSDRVLFVSRFPQGFRLQVSFDECVRFSATSLKNGREACRHEHPSIDHRSGNRATRWIPMIEPTSLPAESNTEGD